jgi:hypothetical protein
MKAALDTNAIISLCGNDAWIDRVVRHFQDNPIDSLVLVVQAMDEVQRLSQEQRANLARLEAVCIRDEQRYFTLGLSVLDGPDVLRGDTAERDGIQREIRDVGHGYERYVRRQEAHGSPVASIEKWHKRINNQTDAVIYERATELGCNVLVTGDDKDITKKVPATNSCQPVSLADFIAGLNP